MTTYILGAGPTGMAIVDGIVDANAGPFVLIERSETLGGLAQTLHWQDVGFHDLGPHKIFSTNADLVARIEGLLPSDTWLTRDKISSIYIGGHYLPYPPSPFSLAGVFGFEAFIKMVIGYGLAQVSSIFSSSNPQTFEQDLEKRLGRPLYEILFKPIAEKLWGDPGKLDVKLSKGRVQTPSLFEVLGRLLKIKKDSDFEALTFRYPRGGLGQLWSAIEAKAKGHGEILLGHTVTGLDLEDGNIQRIRFIFDGVEGVLDLKPGDQVVSTLPLSHTVRILADALPAKILGLAETIVTLNDLLLVFLHVNKPSLIDESWIFVPDSDITFHRVSEQQSFDPAMTQNGSIVCCEIMSSPIRPLGERDDEELCALAENGLHAMGYHDFEILNRRVIRLPKSYPVFNTGYESGLAEIISSLDEIENFRSIGRQGAFNYIGTLDAMDIGYGYAKWLTSPDLQRWEIERERTRHYPVLD